jgi:hypothetical protein
LDGQVFVRAHVESHEGTDEGVDPEEGWHEQVNEIFGPEFGDKATCGLNLPNDFVQMIERRLDALAAAKVSSGQEE